MSLKMRDKMLPSSILFHQIVLCDKDFRNCFSKKKGFFFRMNQHLRRPALIREDGDEKQTVFICFMTRTGVRVEEVAK